MSNLGAFPQDIIQEIRKWSTVSSLLRFRSVSKPWRALIDNPHFVKSHLKHAEESKSTICSLFKNGPTYRIIDLTSLCSEVPPDALRRLDFPCQIQWSYPPSDFFGSVDGLMCAAIGNRGVTVWNPSTRAEWPVPIAHFMSDSTLVKLSFGFGYDSVGDDYKVVWIVLKKTNWDCSTGFSVWIYGFKSRAWREFRDLGYRMHVGQQRGIFLKNAVHWLVHRASYVQYGLPPSIGALDMTYETFRRLSGPGFSKHTCMMSLANLDGSLCLSYTHSKTGEFDLWVMKEYGVEGSWRRLIKLDLGTPAPMPLTLSEDRKEILLYESLRGYFLRYDVRTGARTWIRRAPFGLAHAIGVHVPSLVRLDDENH